MKVEYDHRSGHSFNWTGWNNTKQVHRRYVLCIQNNYIFNQFDLPIQEDGYKCGLYVCQYARQLLQISKVST